MQDQANTTAIRVPWNKGKMSEGRTFPAKLARIRGEIAKLRLGMPPVRHN
jgi:hypothetical protein